MQALSVVVRRHFDPMLAMLREAMANCPEAILMQPELGVREHVYHVLVGMDIWLSANPMAYPFGQILDDDASELKGPASEAITRQYLLDYLGRIEAKVAALPDGADAYMEVVTFGGRQFTLLDRVLTQFRHTQHHIGMINEKLGIRGATPAEWRGYGED